MTARQDRAGSRGSIARQDRAAGSRMIARQDRADQDLRNSRPGSAVAPPQPDLAS
jgi:hypothetical protein